MSGSMTGSAEGPARTPASRHRSPRQGISDFRYNSHHRQRLGVCRGPQFSLQPSEGGVPPLCRGGHRSLGQPEAAAGRPEQAGEALSGLFPRSQGCERRGTLMPGRECLREPGDASGRGGGTGQPREAAQEQRGWLGCRLSSHSRGLRAGEDEGGTRPWPQGLSAEGRGAGMGSENGRVSCKTESRATLE